MDVSGSRMKVEAIVKSQNELWQGEPMFSYEALLTQPVIGIRTLLVMGGAQGYSRKIGCFL
jgi:hypothetical protein